MKRKVLVLRGGPSSEFEVSLKTGQSVIDALKSRHDMRDIVIDKKGDWFDAGMKVVPHKIAKEADVIFNAMHGEYGEDGKVQALLEQIGVPYTGSRALPSATCMNKHMTKRVYADLGLKSPYGMVLKYDPNSSVREIADYVFKSVPMPVVIKPVSGGSSIGVSIAGTLNEIYDVLGKLFVQTDQVLVEEFIKGKEATCGVIDNFRNKDTYALLPIEIRPPGENTFFDYDAKYSGCSEEICPGNFTKEESALLQELAVKAHQGLGLRHYSRTDFIVHPRRGIYILETNSLPGLTNESLLPKSIAAIGLNYEDFLDHLLEEAINEK